MTVAVKQLHLGVVLDGVGHHPAAWRETGTDPGARGVAEVVALVREAERGALDLVVVHGDGAPAGARSTAPAAIVAGVAAATAAIGLVSTVDLGHGGPGGGWRDLVTTAGSDGDRTGLLVDATAGTATSPAVEGAAPPLLVAVGDGDADRGEVARAAARADVVLVDATNLAAARALRTRVLEAAMDAGRDPGQVRVLARIDVLLAATDAEALARRERLDGQLDVRPDPTTAPPAPLDFVGTADGLVDLFVRWVGVVDGFLIRPALLPEVLTAVIDDVVPRLRALGLFRSGYAETSLRARLGLRDPSGERLSVRGLPTT